MITERLRCPDPHKSGKRFPLRACLSDYTPVAWSRNARNTTLFRTALRIAFLETAQYEEFECIRFPTHEGQREKRRAADEDDNTNERRERSLVNPQS